MKKTIFILVLILVACWAIGHFVYGATGLIHILLFLAVIYTIVYVIQPKPRPAVEYFGKNTSYGLFFNLSDGTKLEDTKFFTDMEDFLNYLAIQRKIINQPKHDVGIKHPDGHIEIISYFDLQQRLKLK